MWTGFEYECKTTTTKMKFWYCSQIFIMCHIHGVSDEIYVRKGKNSNYIWFFVYTFIETKARTNKLKKRNKNQSLISQSEEKQIPCAATTRDPNDAKENPSQCVFEERLKKKQS